MSKVQKSDSLKKTIDIGRSVDELEVQFSFVRSLVSDLLKDFIEDTDESFKAIRKTGDQSESLKKEVSLARKKLKSAATLFQDKLENTMEKWKAEIKDDFKYPNKYDKSYSHSSMAR